MTPQAALAAFFEAVAHVASTAVCSRGTACDPGDYGPDPFASEIRGDDTDVWECDSCRYSSARDI